MSTPKEIQDAVAIAVSAIQFYSPRPGDVVVVKLGDKANGFLPSQEQETHVLEMLRELWSKSEPLKPVNFLVTNAYTDISVIRATGRDG